MLKEKIDAVNKLHAWLNNVVPELQAIMAQGYRRKTDGTLFKKDALRFKKITDTSPFRAWIDSRFTDITLHADITYKTGDFSVDYYKRAFCLAGKYNVYPQYKLVDVEENRRLKVCLLGQIYALKQEINKLDTLED